MHTLLIKYLEFSENTSIFKPAMIINNENKKIKKVTIGLLFFLVLAAVTASCIYFNNIINKTDLVGRINLAEEEEQLPAHKKINILLLGIDERKNDIGRSNVTCVVTVDTDTSEVAMLWVPRDSRVGIPKYEWNKIGHTYAYGGPQLSKQTVANLLGIPVDYYLSVNMAGFGKIIDAMGGLEINVEKKMYYNDVYDIGEVDNNGLIDLKPGLQHMNGNTVLQYVRFRNDEMGDIGRIERQQKFAKAFMAALVKPTVIIKLPDIIREVNAAVNTDISFRQMLGLGKVINVAYKKGLKTEMVTGKPVYIDNISYWLPDIAAMRKQVARIQGLAIDDKYLAYTKKLEAEHKKSLANCKVIDAP